MIALPLSCRLGLGKMPAVIPVKGQHLAEHSVRSNAEMMAAKSCEDCMMIRYAPCVRRVDVIMICKLFDDPEFDGSMVCFFKTENEEVLYRAVSF
jgi:hypothetical protein